jgi:hypothetical protein
VGVGTASLGYSLRRSRVGLSATASSSAFYYDQAGADLIYSHGASASQRVQLGRSTTLVATETARREPFRLDRLFPGAGSFSFGAPSGLPTDTFAGSEKNLDLGANVDLHQQVSERVSMNAGYSYSSNDWDSNRRVFQGGRAGLGIGFGRGVTMRLGYGYYQSEYRETDARRVDHHNIDAGLDYSGAISLSRRTALSFSTGSMAIRDRDEMHVRLTGRARLSREIGRSWVAAVEYNRDAFYVDQFSEVVFSDAASFSLGGLINRRLSFHSGVGASMGEVGFGSSSNGAHSVYGRAGVTTALTRKTAVGVDYNYYFHSFGEGITLPSGVVRDIDRHSVRAYITVWAPLMTGVRSSNATR